MADNANRERRDIQGLRAVAAVAVVLFHATSVLPGGFLGVDVFFVISGFIIAQTVSLELARTNTFSFFNFMLRRLRRVLPPMAVVILVTIAAGSLIDTPSHGATVLPATGLAALTGWVNFYFYSAATDYFQSFQTNPLLHFWSLAVEIQFYTLFALVLRASLGLGVVLRSGANVPGANPVAQGIPVSGNS